MSAYPNAFVPDRIPSNGVAIPAAANRNTNATRTPIPGDKRPRRMRSVQGAAHYGNGQKGKKGPGASKKEYHDRKNSPPIFLEKTFVMISTCDPALAGWTEDGTMFVIKDQKTFEQQIIPQFFDHNKFSSFARQLNFYGFRKMQSRAIYNDDVNKETAKYVTFFNEKFQRDRKDLLKGIQRSTKGGNNAASSQEQQKEINSLKDRVTQLESNNNVLQEQLNALQSQINQLFSNQNVPQSIDHFAPLPVHVSVPPRMGSKGSTNEENVNAPYGRGGSYGSNGHHENHINYHGNNVAPSISETDPADNTARDPSLPTLSRHPNAKVLPDKRALPPPPKPMRENSFLRGFSNPSLGDFGSDGMSPFERRFLVSTLAGPDPENSAPQEIAQRPSLQREMSEQLNQLNLDEYPPLPS
jgi:hypothetical protein